MKRLFDILIASIALLVLFPLSIPIMLALRLSDEGVVFYRQTRIGYKNQPFKIWKFATMLKNSPNIGSGSLTLRQDPRVTRLGSWLRRTKINELPQIINLLLGNMTLVGPRPQMKVDFEAFPMEIQETIYNVRPGITGIGSIVFRDEEALLSLPGRSPLDFYITYIAPYKGELELWYQSHASFWTDFKLLMLTIWVVFFPTANLTFRVFPDLPKPPAALFEL